MMRPAIGSVLACSVGEEQIAGDPRLRHQVRLDHADPRRPLHRGEVLRRRLHLLVGHRLRQFDHRVGVRLSRIGGVSQAVSKVVDLADEVGDGERRRRGIFRTSLPVRQVTRAASARRVAQPSGTVRDDVGHRRVIAGKPVDHVLTVADVHERVRRAAARRGAGASSARPDPGSAAGSGWAASAAAPCRRAWAACRSRTPTAARART